MLNSISIGIIGNYFGHLSGAENVKEHPLPNGIFVIHCDHPETVTSGVEAKYPQSGTDLDIEPEFVIRFATRYQNGRLSELTATHMTIGNDFTIRSLDGSSKISQRKAWGEKSKGINSTWWQMQEFTKANYGKNLNLISYIERDGKFHCATELVDCLDTKLFHGELIEWIIERVNHQQDEGMYEEIHPEFSANNFPEELILYTGAPNYSGWGEENFIETGDKVHISAFKTDKYSPSEVKKRLLQGELVNDSHMLSFTQVVV